MMTLGIPGDAVTAVIIGALYIHGLKPGPMLMSETPELFWFTVGSLTLANIFLLIFGLTGIKLFAKIVETPKAILLPLILALLAAGAYAINNNPNDVYWMLGFGVLGYFLKMYGFQVGPVMVGRTREAIVDELAAIVPKGPDLLEWRIDFFEAIGDLARVVATARAIRAAAGGIPVLLTRRNVTEGGSRSRSPSRRSSRCTSRPARRAASS